MGCTICSKDLCVKGKGHEPPSIFGSQSSDGKVVLVNQSDIAPIVAFPQTGDNQLHVSLTARL